MKPVSHTHKITSHQCIKSSALKVSGHECGQCGLTLLESGPRIEVRIVGRSQPGRDVGQGPPGEVIKGTVWPGPVEEGE